MDSRTSKHAQSPSSGRPETTRRAGKGPDGIVLLKEDHKRVSAMFAQYRKLMAHGTDAAKQKLAGQICGVLKVHTTIEEEIFYPAARAALAAKDDDMLDEATVEHASAKALIAQLESASPGDQLYDAKVTVLGEYVKHHVKEEQEEMFPKCRKAKMDLRGLGAQMAARKAELA